LREIVKEFVSAIIQRAIIMKEQEVRLKGKLKVWKYHSEEVGFFFSRRVFKSHICLVTDFHGECLGSHEDNGFRPFEWSF